VTRRDFLFALVLLLGLPELILADGRLDIVVSIPPHRWLVEQIGGDRVSVSVLVAPSESPTTYMPSDIQVTHLMRAHLYCRAGVPFESGPWFDAISKMGRFEMVDLREGIELQGEDPHIWLNPKLLSIQASAVAEALSAADPTNRTHYQANLHRLNVRLEILDEEIRQSLAPFTGRRFFVFHPSWGYFAREYGLRQVAIEIEGREPSDLELTRLLTEASRAQATTVFVQPQIHGRAAQAFAEAIGARVETLDPLAADVAGNLAETTATLIEAFGGGAIGER